MTAIVALLLCPLLKAETSKIIPVFMEAAEMYVEDSSVDQLVIRPDLKKIIDLLESKNIPKEYLRPYLAKNREKAQWLLPADDKYDGWKTDGSFKGNVPEVALHAFRMDVVEESDDFFKDDIYVYYFITDGVIPTGKVTSIYKGIKAGQSFFFNEIDRAIYPLVGIPAKSPENHLIVDYGIIESDGDDIKDLQKLSSIIIDIAIAVYSSYDPQNAEILIKLRKEIKALADLLLSMNNDDRLVTGTFGFKANEIADVLGNSSYIEFKKTHKHDSTFDSWEYDLRFRMIRK